MAFPLPEAFLSRMQQLLPEKSEYESFIQSYDKDHYQALRINPLKGDAWLHAYACTMVLHRILLSTGAAPGQIPVSRSRCLLHTGTECDGTCCLFRRTAR